MISFKGPMENDYTSYQYEFLCRLNAEVKPGSIHLLLAPVGTGKTTVLASGIANLLKQEHIKRTLVLLPAAVVPHWAELLHQRDVETDIVDGRALRLLLENIAETDKRWPTGVFLMSIDRAKSMIYRELLCSAEWDLVIVDEAHMLTGHRLDLIEDFIEKTDPPSLLLATYNYLGNEGLQRFAERGTLINWYPAVKDFRTKYMADRELLIRQVTHSFRRTDEEVELASQIMGVGQIFEPFLLETLLRRASSSINGFEETLLRLIEKQQVWSDYNLIEEMVSETDVSVPFDTNQLAQSEIVQLQAIALEDLLGSVEQLQVDSKLECFRIVVDELLRSGVQHVVVFCDFRSTLDYILAAADTLNCNSFGLHGGIPPDRRQEAFSRFEDEGGLLITTTAALIGLEFNFVEAVIHYDLPMSLKQFYVRESRYDRYGRDTKCTVYFLRDERCAFPQEDINLNMICNADKVSGHLDIDVGENPEGC